MSIDVEPELTFPTPVRTRSKRKPPTLTLASSSNHSTPSLHQPSPRDSLFPSSPGPPSYLSRAGSLGPGSPHNVAPPAYTSPRLSEDSGITHQLDAYPFVFEYETSGSATAYEASKRNSIGSTATSFNTADDDFTSYVSPEPGGSDESTSSYGKSITSSGQMIILDTENPDSASTPTHVRTLVPGESVPESTTTSLCSFTLSSSPNLVSVRIPSLTPSEGGGVEGAYAQSSRWQLPSDLDQQGDSEVSMHRITIFPGGEKSDSADQAGSPFHFENLDQDMDDEEDTESEEEDTRDTSEPETMIPREGILLGLSSNGNLRPQRSAGYIGGLSLGIGGVRKGQKRGFTNQVIPDDDGDNSSSSSSTAEIEKMAVKEGKRKDHDVKDLLVKASGPGTDEDVVLSELKARLENRRWGKRKRNSELELQASTSRSQHLITHRSSAPLLKFSSLSRADPTHSSDDKPLPDLPINSSSISLPQRKYPEQDNNDHKFGVTQTAGDGTGDRPRKSSKASRTLSTLSRKSSAWALSVANVKPKLGGLKIKGLDSFKRGSISSSNLHPVTLANLEDGISKEDSVKPTSGSGSGSGESRPGTSRSQTFKHSFNSNSAKMMESLNALNLRDSVQMKQMKNSLGKMVKRPKSSQGIGSSASFSTTTPSSLFSPHNRSSQSHIPSSSIATTTSALPTSSRRLSAINLFTPAERLEEHRRPSAVQIKEAYGLGVFDERGMEITFESIVEGKGKVAEKCIVCFIRHFWCPLCQDYMYSIARSVDPKWLEQSRVRLVVISNGSWKMIKAYKRIFHFPFSLYTDPSLALYATLGMTLKTLDGGPESEKGMYVQHGAVSGIAMVVGNAVKARVPVWEPGGDTEQLGGEFVFGPGMKCTFAHRMRTTRAHVPIEEVLAAAGVDMPLAPSAQRPLSEEEELALAEERRNSLAQLQEVEKGTIETGTADKNSDELVFASIRASFDQPVASSSMANGHSHSHTHKRTDSAETTKPRRSRSSGQIVATASAGQWRGTTPLYRNIKDPFPQLSSLRLGMSNGSTTSLSDGQVAAGPSNPTTVTSIRLRTSSRPSSAIATSCPNSAIGPSCRPSTAPRPTIASVQTRPDNTLTHPGTTQRAGNKVTLKLVKGKWTQAQDITDVDDTTEAGTEAGSDSDSTISSLEG